MVTGLEFAAAYAPLALVAQLALHEGSHAAVALMAGRKVEIHLLPTQLDDGRLVFGYTKYLGDEPLPSNWALAMYAAPRITDLLMIILLPLWYLHAEALQGIRDALTLTATVDFAIGTTGIFFPSGGNDAWRVYQNLGRPNLTAYRIVSVALTSAAVGWAAGHVLGFPPW